MGRKKKQETSISVWGGLAVDIVHIIPQAYWHTPAFIVGNETGLRALHAAITAALAFPSKAQKASVMCDDGEGYGIIVRCVPTETMASCPMGYSDEIARSDEPWPKWMTEA